MHLCPCINDYFSLVSIVKYKPTMTSIVDVEKKRRTVFKPLLDNPFPQAEFPFIDSAIQSQILEFLLLQLQEIKKFNDLKTQKFTPNEPECLKHITLGFNSTVKVLEAQAKSKFKKTPLNTTPLKYVFVCKPDIEPPLITQQFPTLCYTSSTESNIVKLIALPRGSMSKIEEALGKPTGIIGMESFEGISSSFKDLLDDVPDVKVPWLENMSYQALNVKMLKTTAPIKGKVTKGKIEKKKKNKPKADQITKKKV